MKARNLSRLLALAFTCLLALNELLAQTITVTVDASQDKKLVSPYIYGRNNTFDKPAQFYKDAGLCFARMNGGNNATKYNWRLKLSSHPDWYNNVYSNNWDNTSAQIANSLPEMQIMWAFQLLGRVASNDQHNFNDWAFNQSKWWDGVHQNLAGGGVANTTGVNPGKASAEGDVNLYTVEWPADSTVGILNHWFGEDGLGFNKQQFLYWNMDNEPDIWNGTHDDAMPGGLISSAEFVDRFIDVAKKAKAIFPEIKICGPVTTSEWQWYKWGDESIRLNGKYYCWFEYFIKRCADEEKASGIRVLDVFDIHHYPYAPADKDALQNYRAFYDPSYVYPGANGVKTINGGWDNAQNKEYIFKRIEDWLNLYYGEGHGITVGLSEWSPGPNEPNLASVIYSTHLGLFANHGVEYFTPWNWFTGMWESLHLFSRYAKNNSVSSVSSADNIISAFTTINNNADSMTVILVNKDMNASQSVTVSLNGGLIPNGTYSTLQLSSLPASETFKSHTDNALKKGTISVSEQSFTINVPKLSTTAVLLTGSGIGTGVAQLRAEDIRISPVPASRFIKIELGGFTDKGEMKLFSPDGRLVMQKSLFDTEYEIVDISTLNKGLYILKLSLSQGVYSKVVLVD